MNKNFSTKLMTLMTGTGLAQVISLLFIYLLTFFYTPIDYKNYAVFVGIVTVIGGVITLKYELAIPLVKKAEDAISLVYLGFIITTILSIILFLISITLVIIFFNNLIFYVLIGSVTIFFVGIYNTLLHWALREECFKEISLSRVGQSTVGGLVHTLLGLVGFTKYGLPIGNFFNFNAGIFKLFKLFKYKEYKINIDNCKNNFFVLKKYPLYSTLEYFFMNLSQHASIILIGIFYGVKAGVFMLCMRIMAAPVGLIGENLKSLYLSEIGKQDRESEIQDLTRVIIAKSVYFGSIPMLIISLVGYFYADLFFPKSWNGIGYYMVFIAPWMSTSLASRSFSIYYNYIGKQEINFYFNIIVFILGILTLFLGFLYEISKTIELFCIINFITYFSYYLFTSSKTKTINKTFFATIFFQALLLIVVVTK